MKLRGQRIHFMGVGGIGVCALAEWAYREGALVSGCDLYESETTRRLRALGIPVEIGHDPRHLDGIDLLVHTSAVRPDHPERARAEERGIAVRRGSFLARLLAGRRVIGICGTHGKSTTTWLTAQLLVRCGFDPTVMLGAVGAGESSNLRLGYSDLAVTELDESDKSFLEPKLAVAVVTNVEADHLDQYGSEEALRAAFVSFARGVAGEGTLVLSADDPVARALSEGQGGRVLTAGLDEGAFLRARDLTAEGMGHRFLVREEGAAVGRAFLRLPGRHNIANAMLALAACRAVGATWDELLRALPACTGVGRRFEVLGTEREITVVDDYAHHPSEIAATLRAARSVHPGRVFAVFQPHLYSRTKFLCASFGRELAKADRVLLLDIYPAREDPIPGVDSSLVVDAVRRHNGKAEGPVARSEAVDAVLRSAAPGDMVLFLGAGDIGVCGHAFLGALRHPGP